MRVLVCGSRGWDDEVRITNRLADLPDGTLIICGGADGADLIARDRARLLGLHTAEVRPLWSRFGKRAGHVRNAVMLDLEPDLVIAFTLGTAGTQGTIDGARKRGIPVEVHGSEKGTNARL